MSGKDIFALAGFGLLSLYGVLVWRTAWTAEMPKSLRDAERGWRLRLAVGLGVSPPTQRYMPALIICVWAGFAFLVANVIDQGGTVAQALLVCWLVTMLLLGIVAMFNRPKFLIPPYARDWPGIVGQWMGKPAGGVDPDSDEEL